MLLSVELLLHCLGYNNECTYLFDELAQNIIWVFGTIQPLIIMETYLSFGRIRTGRNGIYQRTDTWPKQLFFQYEFEGFTKDFLPSKKAPRRFRAFFNQRETVIINSIGISFIS